MNAIEAASFRAIVRGYRVDRVGPGVYATVHHDAVTMTHTAGEGEESRHVRARATAYTYAVALRLPIGALGCTDDGRWLTATVCGAYVPVVSMLRRPGLLFPGDLLPYGDGPREAGDDLSSAQYLHVVRSARRGERGYQDVEMTIGGSWKVAALPNRDRVLIFRPRLAHVSDVLRGQG